MKHQLIIVDGHSTVGKSTTSKSLYKQIAYHDKAYWLHEECQKHPIRFEEFEEGDIHTLDGMDINRKIMLQKWEKFREEIKLSKQVCITEGCFLHSVDRYLLNSAWNEEQIKDYFHQILEIIRPLNPLIIFLYRPDMKSSFEKAFMARGDCWKQLILSVPGPYGFFRTHEYTGDDSIFDSLAYEQEQMAKIFDVLSCDKLKIDTKAECWDSYVREITEFAGYRYYEEDNKMLEIEKYCGTYRLEEGEDTWDICFDNKTKQIYTSLFWSYMPMKYIGKEQFELISFPVILQFDFIEGKTRFIVSGNYDWKYNDRMFIKI